MKFAKSHALGILIGVVLYEVWGHKKMGGK